MSYHYAPPADYIDIPGGKKVSEIFSALGVPHVCGKTWTPDAFYRELRHQMEARRAEGCLTVDMELAGVQAVCAFHGWELYSFLQCGDVLTIKKATVSQKKTNPPAHYTDDTLLKAMEDAGKTIEDEELREKMKESGLAKYTSSKMHCRTGTGDSAKYMLLQSVLSGPAMIISPGLTSRT